MCRNSIILIFQTSPVLSGITVDFKVKQSLRTQFLLLCLHFPYYFGMSFGPDDI